MTEADLQAMKDNQRRAREPKAPPPERGTITFHVPGDPVPQGSMKGFVAAREDGSQYAALTSANDGLGPWRKAVALYASSVRPRELWTEAVRCDVVFRCARPKSAPKRSWPITRSAGDGDKLQRAIWDACTGIIFKDDSQVVLWSGVKMYGAPGCAVTITLAGDP